MLFNILLDASAANSIAKKTCVECKTNPGLLLRNDKKPVPVVRRPAESVVEGIEI